ncbi:MAG: 2Fe-2S iron-sulfur cluster-binding protein [Planctomycetota bacterium]
MSDTTRILVDGVEHEAPLGGRLIDFLNDLAKDVPHFCYHPGLPIDASCRQCQVESKGKSSKPGLIVACRETIVEGMEILTGSPAVEQARAAVMEFLLKNHPLDCPICDKAGECTLQDNAYRTGQDEGRTHEPRRHLPKRKDLGDKILLDNERCILCRRCIRFFDHVTGEPQLKVFSRGDRSWLGTFFDEPLTGNYQGNIVDVCPVGALTLKKFRFRSRPWFMQRTNTVCGSCSRGCNTVVETRDDEILRIRPRLTPEVNGFWMCDEGRLDYDAYNLGADDGRLVEPAVADAGGALATATLDEAVAALARWLREGDGQAVALLSPWATLEDGAAFAALCEALGDGLAAAGFFQPAPSGRGDALLRTDEDAPNCRGLREAGLTAIDAASLERLLDEKLAAHHGRARILLSGYGLDRLLPDGIKLRAKGVGEVALHGHVLASFPFARLAIPARTPMEKAGYWVNLDGRRQYLRPALKAPASVPDDAAFLARVAAELSRDRSGQEVEA